MRRENVVTNAVESAPSANRSRNMLGARKAVRNASILRGAEERSENHLADQPEHPAAKHGKTNNARRSGAHSPIVRRSHRRILTTNTHE